MTKDVKESLDPKESLARLKRKLGREKYRDLAALVLERKVEGVSPKLVVEEIKAKFGDIDIKPHLLAIFIKY